MNAEDIAKLIGAGIAGATAVAGVAWRFVGPLYHEWKPEKNGNGNGETHKSHALKLDEVHKGVLAIAEEQQGLRGDVRRLTGRFDVLEADVEKLKEKGGNG